MTIGTKRKNSPQCSVQFTFPSRRSGARNLQKTTKKNLEQKASVRWDLWGRNDEGGGERGREGGQQGSEDELNSASVRSLMVGSRSLDSLSSYEYIYTITPQKQRRQRR